MYHPDPQIRSLDGGYYDEVGVAVFPQPRLRFRNQRAAGEVGLEGTSDAEWMDYFSNFSPLPDNLSKPLALRYHGHQFTHYNPQLGDGRGFLHAQLRDHRRRLLDLGTKGSGTTPWSRGGDGRLTLKGGLREVLAAEQLQALGVPTCRIFSLVETGEELVRYDEPSPTRASVMVRLSHSHIRFGTFQRLAWYKDRPRMDRLVAYVHEHYYPQEEPNPVALLAAVARRTAETVAGWMVAGFVHGVLNTDNMNITGESFDYGPWRFIPHYDPDFVAAYFDEGGLYAYGRQATMVGWNLQQLARALELLVPAAELAKSLELYEPAVQSAFQRRLLLRLGLHSAGPVQDARLVERLLSFAERSRVGWDQLFFDWYGGLASEARAAVAPTAKTYSGPSFVAFREQLEHHAPRHPERLHHPFFQGDHPPSMLITEVEALWDAISHTNHWELLDQKVEAIRQIGEVFPDLGAQEAEAAG